METKFVGHLTVEKVYPDGARENLFTDHNIVVEGMGYGLTRLLAAKTSDKLSDFRVQRFQVGTDAVNHFGAPDFYNLSGALTTDQYGTNTNVGLVSHNILSATSPFTSSISLVTASADFGILDQSKITIMGDTGVEFSIILDENTANGLNISEIGLFALNPDGEGKDKSVMVAYRSFGPYPKTSDFALRFHWIIEGLDCSECTLIPTYQNVYYGLSSVPESSRRVTQNLDIYAPKDTTAPRATVIWMHAGQFNGGSKLTFNPFFAKKILKSGMNFVSVDYAKATSDGTASGTVPVTHPVMTSGAGFGSQDDDATSNNSRIPTSSSPLTLEDSDATNAYTDAVRAVQFLRHTSATYNIDSDHLILWGDGTGGTLALWTAYAANAQTTSALSADLVEETSSRVFAVGGERCITDWLGYIPYNMRISNRLNFVPVGRTAFDLNGVQYAASGTAATLTSSAFYPSGTQYTPNYRNVFEPHLISSMNAIMGSSIPPLSFGGRTTVDFNDWGNLPQFKDFIEWMEVPLTGAKTFWSPYYQASATGSEFAGGISARIGHVDNSGVYCNVGYMGATTSSAGLSAVPGWKIILPQSTIAALASSIETGNPSAPYADMLGTVAANAVPSSITLREHLVSSTTSATEIARLESSSVSALLDISGFEWGSPVSGLDFWYVSAILDKYGQTSAIVEPYVNIETSSFGPILSSSSFGNFTSYTIYPLAPDEQDPLHGGRLLDILRSAHAGGVHTASSVFGNYQSSEYISVENKYNTTDSNVVAQMHNDQINWIIGILSDSVPYYEQFIGTIP